MRLKFAGLFLLFLSFNYASAQEKPLLAQVDRIRLAEAFRLGDQIGDNIWTSWNKVPFATLLVTNDYEFLIRHPHPSSDFASLGYDALLKSDVFYRKRTFDKGLLATFPAIDGSITSTIVIGQAENTSAKTSTPWVITLLHEHFHQLQDSQPNFYPDIAALKLSRGDQSGMWMLNYPFPYERNEVQNQFAAMSQLLGSAIQTRKADHSRKSLPNVAPYIESRRKFRELLSADDYKYLAFQLWKEGIARYTEYQVAYLAGAKYKPTKEFSSLNDYQPFETVATSIYERIMRELVTQKLGDSKRVVVYSFGAAEGLLLDQVNPGWRNAYFLEKFDLLGLYPAN